MIFLNVLQNAVIGWALYTSLPRNVTRGPVHWHKKRVDPKRANWKAIADNLMTIEKPKFKVDARAVREKYAYLAGKPRNKLKEEEKASGIGTETTEV